MQLAQVFNGDKLNAKCENLIFFIVTPYLIALHLILHLLSCALLHSHTESTIKKLAHGATKSAHTQLLLLKMIRKNYFYSQAPHNYSYHHFYEITIMIVVE